MRSTLFRATALAAGLAVALVGAPAVSAPLAGAAPVAAAVQKADAGFETVAWRHHYHRHHGFGPGALFAGAALGLIGASIAGAFSGPDYYDYGYPYCDPYDPYTACYSYGPSYVYGGGYYPFWRHHHGFYSRGYWPGHSFAQVNRPAFGGFHNFGGHAFAGGQVFAGGHAFGGNFGGMRHH